MINKVVKIYLLSLTTIISSVSFAANCDQYASPADKKSCLELNALINQTEQNSMKVYNESVAKAQSSLQKGQPSEVVTPTITTPSVQPTPAVTQPAIQQPVQQPQPQQPKRTRIYY